MSTRTRMPLRRMRAVIAVGAAAVAIGAGFAGTVPASYAAGPFDLAKLTLSQSEVNVYDGGRLVGAGPEVRVGQTIEIFYRVANDGVWGDYSNVRLVNESGSTMPCTARLKQGEQGSACASGYTHQVTESDIGTLTVTMQAQADFQLTASPPRSDVTRSAAVSHPFHVLPNIPAPVPVGQVTVSQLSVTGEQVDESIDTASGTATRRFREGSTVTWRYDIANTGATEIPAWKATVVLAVGKNGTPWRVLPGGDTVAASHQGDGFFLNDAAAVSGEVKYVNKFPIPPGGHLVVSMSAVVPAGTSQGPIAVAPYAYTPVDQRQSDGSRWFATIVDPAVDKVRYLNPVQP